MDDIIKMTLVIKDGRIPNSLNIYIIEKKAKHNDWILIGKLWCHTAI